jgi:N-acetylmuramoyl-L-alanine amidase
MDSPSSGDAVNVQKPPASHKAQKRTPSETGIFAFDRAAAVRKVGSWEDTDLSPLYALRVFWYRADKGPWVFVLVVGLIVALLGLLLTATFTNRDERRNRARELDRQNLACLARNVYFEARGEPAAGQYAVAEVTMNREASRLFPRTVCAVVYQKNWDPILRRYVGAFSWTEFDELPAPSGAEWDRAWKVAEAVYYQRHTPMLEGALFFHATHITPSWAKDKKRVARIGRHVFYR